MTMTGDLMTRDLPQLNELFLMAKADSDVLEKIEDELRYRLTSQALALLIEVRGVLTGLRTSHSHAVMLWSST